MQTAVYETHTDGEGHEKQHIAGLERRTMGQLSDGEYKRAVRDLVNFLDYVGEPAKLVRYKIGVWVILYLLILLGATYMLKREFWKAVH
ncbi:MAG: cytochrome c1 [Gammaproteobacteria bacterium]|nr:cytochrome c1 [Gammaproteobacteria bacterium]